MSVRIEDKDMGYRKALARVLGKKPMVKVGIFGKKGDEVHDKSQLSILDIATFHEFGLGTVPERSFIRAWCDENQASVSERLRADSERAVAGEITWEDVLERLGQFVVAGIQARMAEGIPPPLAESTIARKGSSVPLIDSGQMRGSIDYEVIESDA